MYYFYSIPPLATKKMPSQGSPLPRETSTLWPASSSSRRSTHGGERVGALASRGGSGIRRRHGQSHLDGHARGSHAGSRDPHFGRLGHTVSQQRSLRFRLAWLPDDARPPRERAFLHGSRFARGAWQHHAR